MTETISKFSEHPADTLASGVVRAASSLFPGGKTLMTFLFPMAAADFAGQAWDRGNSAARLGFLLSYAGRLGGDIAQLVSLGEAFAREPSIGQEFALPLYLAGILAKGAYNTYWLLTNRALISAP